MSTPNTVQPIAPCDLGSLDVTYVREDILAAVTFAATVVPKRAPVPILTCVLLDVAGVTGYDYETAARVELRSDNGTGAGIATPAIPLRDLIKSLAKGARVRLHTVAERLAVETDGATYTLPLLDKSDWPDVPTAPTSGRVTFTPDAVAGILAGAVAAAKGDVAPALEAVCFDPTSGTWCTAATDRYRLSCFDTGAAARQTSDRILVPAYAVKELKRFSGPVTMTYRLADAGRSVGFTDGTRTLVTRPVDADFPRYRALWPDREPGGSLSVTVADLTAAITRAATGQSRTSPVVLDLADNLVLSVTAKDADTVRVTLAGTYAGEPLTIGLNPAYALDAARTFGKGARVDVAFFGPTKPMVYTSPDAPAMRVLVMPVRLSD